MKSVFTKKAGEQFHLDEWLAFLCSLSESWEQPHLEGDPGMPGNTCCVLRDFVVTIEAATEEGKS